MDRNKPPPLQNTPELSQQKSGFNSKFILWCLAATLGLLATFFFTAGPRHSGPQPSSTQTSQAPAGTTTHAAQLRHSGEERPPPAKLRFGPLTRQHFTQFDQWMETAPRQHYFIQLLATDAQHTGEIEGFLSRATRELDPADLRAYRSSLSGTDRVGVIYGDFPSREAASIAMQSLPDSIKAAQPFPRQVAKLR